MKRVMQQSVAKSRTPLFALSMLLGSAVSLYGQNGSISFSEFLNAAGALMAFLILVGAILVVCGFIFAVGKFMGGRMGDAAIGVVGVIAGGLIVGYSKTWASSLTGQTLP